MGMHRLKDHKTGLFARMGGSFSRAFFLLEIYRDDLDPQAITDVLGISPTKSYRKGDERPKGSQYYRTGGWILDSGEQQLADDDGGDKRLQDWLASLPSDATIWKSLQSYEPRVRLVLYTDQMNAEFRLRPLAANELSKRGLTLLIDPYLELDE